MPVVHPADVTVDSVFRFSRSFLLAAVRLKAHSFWYDCRGLIERKWWCF